MDRRKEIAEELRSAREKLGLTLEQAAADAGVPSRYVRILEGKALGAIGVADDLYLIPFFRRYATFVGADVPRLLPEFLGTVQHVPPPMVSVQRPSFRSPLGFLWKPAAVLGAATLAVLLILAQAPERAVLEDDEWSDAEPEPAAPDNEKESARTADHAGGVERPPAVHQESAPPEIGATLAAGQATEIPSVDAAPTPEAGGSGAVLAPAVHDGSARELRIVADEEAWVSIGVDSQPKKSVLLQPGESQTWTANEAFTLTLGNGGGVRISLDGRELPRFGRSGEVVRNLRLPRTEAASPANR